MQRSSSVTRTFDSDEFFVDMSGSALASSYMKLAASDELPIHDHSVSDDVTKKEITHHGMSLPGQKAVHLIPLVILICGFILWMFSH
ncbi:hypothetical protein TanjilG_18549 [Lupinus angustifolius]|uniref:Uncharacterized protein n=1 Tax=Lupinus angustifolius TaxID=3871 RepID=A0A4P1RXF5_LUPAN|nr:hypothetical protein TanjilG_18549 [Lupinus angustifolius]